MNLGIPSISIAKPAIGKTRSTTSWAVELTLNTAVVSGVMFRGYLIGSKLTLDSSSRLA